MKRVCTLMVATLLFAQGSAHAAGIGRLFLTQGERDALDAARQGSVAAQQTQAEATPDAPAQTPDAQLEPPPAPVTVNGYVARSAGAATVWINGSDSAPGKLTAPARDGQRVRVPLGRGGSEVSLKPGESFDPDSRQVSDAYQNRPAAER